MRNSSRASGEASAGVSQAAQRNTPVECSFRARSARHAAHKTHDRPVHPPTDILPRAVCLMRTRVADTISLFLRPPFPDVLLVVCLKDRVSEEERGKDVAQCRQARRTQRGEFAALASPLSFITPLIAAAIGPPLSPAIDYHVCRLADIIIITLISMNARRTQLFAFVVVCFQDNSFW